jgi:hypothetical protein
MNSRFTLILNIITVIITLLTNIKYYNPLMFLFVSIALLSGSVFSMFFVIMKVMHSTIKIEKVLFSIFSLIISYTLIYMALQNYDINSFHNIIQPETNNKNNSILDNYKKFIRDFFDMSYFTTVTLATVGYGDITPKSRTARFFVMTQILLGLFMISILFTKTF